ncbi:ATP-binding protein [Xenorhabdus bovienii]|uniref:ATP-binding protein n=1 Tax=Xenorhabdus bovienii TaxID=40576 RepID=UPI0023B21EC4|nr:ATP-binding protein [Xenorhabdus bovienii]
MSKLSRSQLLILDDWGLESLTADQRSDLLEIVDQLYQRGSVLLISQLPIEKWHQMIGDATHADAILDGRGSREYQSRIEGRIDA